MKIKIYLRTELRRHGASKIRDSEQTNLAVKKVMKALSHRKASGNINQGYLDKGTSDGPLEYGTHRGSVHVHEICTLEGTPEEISQEILTKRGIMNTFRNLPSIDLDERKMAYSQQVTQIAREYERKYGNNLPPSKSIEYTNRCADFAFKYYRHQIIIQMIGTKDEFSLDSGAILCKKVDGGEDLYLLESKVRSIITDSLLSSTDLDRVSNGTDKVVNAESKDIDFTCVLKTTRRGMKYEKVRNDKFEPMVDKTEIGFDYVLPKSNSDEYPY